MRTNPEATVATYQQALSDAGYPAYDLAEIEVLFRRLAARRYKEPENAREQSGKHPRRRRALIARQQSIPDAVIRRSTVVVADTDRCPSCGVVPDQMTGAYLVLPGAGVCVDWPIRRSDGANTGGGVRLHCGSATVTRDAVFHVPILVMTRGVRVVTGPSELGWR
ncbi:hypothetical protein [Nocardia cyriacigeorgica]|uniref:hypothetical protein n=1 Tax=Nocardia cyriacigeorgica TaxID=135487 RepID=UPI002453C10C|nr:hypothetical protein [Nocardia cyriacigeorgica]